MSTPATAAVRKIVHVDMDAFYASVEQRDRPELRGRPVVVAWRGARSVVCAASYEARTFGVRSAMPALRAERLCPQAVFVPPDFPRYREVSHRVRGIFLRYTDLVEPLSLDEAYLDVTVNKPGLSSATEVARRIRAEIRADTGLTASAGVAPNKFLAKIASDWNKPDGLFVIRPGEVEAFLAPLPVKKLPGVGRATEQVLSALGITTVADLRGFDRARLQERFGRFGLRLHALAHGVDDHPVLPDRPLQSISAEETFEADLPLTALGPAIRSAARRVWLRREKTDRIGRTVFIKLKTADFRQITRSVTPPQPPASEDALAEIATSLLAQVDLPGSTRYRLAGVGLGNFREPGAEDRQPALF
ncbi:MAG: DNA polymerase IV [Gammaproteobacteria bacterium]